jgi:hypothetical protein
MIFDLPFLNLHPLFQEHAWGFKQRLVVLEIQAAYCSKYLYGVCVIFFWVSELRKTAEDEVTWLDSYRVKVTGQVHKIFFDFLQFESNNIKSRQEGVPVLDKIIYVSKWQYKFRLHTLIFMCFSNLFPENTTCFGWCQPSSGVYNHKSKYRW